MENNGDFSIALKLPRAEIQKAVVTAIHSELAADIDASVDEIRKALTEKQRGMNKELDDLFSVSLADKQAVEKIRSDAFERQASAAKELDELFKQVSTAKRDVESEIDKIKEKVTRQANWYLIPTATVILLAGILGLWAILGASAVQLRTTVNGTIDEATKLHQSMDTTTTSLSKVQQDLIAAQKTVIDNQASIDKVKAGNPFLEHGKSIDQLKQDIIDLKNITKTLKTRLDADEEILKRHNLK
jgi:hypothetical protein